LLALRKGQVMAKPSQHRNRWRIRWIDAFGKRRSEVYERYDDADFALKRHQVEAEEVRRGLRSLEVSDKTFSELCDYWLQYRTVRKRRQRDDQSIIRCHLLPEFRKIRLSEITVELVDRFIAARGHLHKKTVHNYLTLLISMLNLAHSLGWIFKVPKIKKPKISLFSNDFPFLKTEEDIRIFLLAAKEENESVFNLYASAIYTGLRQGELAALRWDDVDLERRLITVQRSFGGPTKAGDVRYVPILDPLLPLIREWKLRCPNHLVFPNQAGQMQHPSSRVFKQVFRRILARAQIKTPITFHGLRHTFASHWVMGGGSLFKLQQILGHKSTQMTMRYAHLSPNAFSEDYLRLGSSWGAENASVYRFDRSRN